MILQLLPSRGRVCFLTTWIWPVLIFVQVPNRGLKRLCPHILLLLEPYHHHINTPQWTCRGSHGTELGCPKWSHPKTSHDQLNVPQPIAEHKRIPESSWLQKKHPANPQTWAKKHAYCLKSLSFWVVCIAITSNWYKNNRKIKLNKILSCGGSQSSGWGKSACISVDQEE